MKTFINISELLPMDYKSPYRRGNDMSKLQIVKDAYLQVNEGKVVDYGYMKDLDDVKGEVIDCDNLTVTPGLIDSHTHLVFGGSREKEIPLKMAGHTYLDILKMGYGIHSTVNSTKESSYEELLKKAKNSANEMISNGVTSIEAKSGYGLDEETELKQLSVIDEIKNILTVKSTFLGAHVIPKDKTATEHLNNMKIFIKKHKNLFDYVDIFIEDSVFNVQDSRDYLEFARNEGLNLRVHADEIEPLKGTEMAVELGAKSVDHLIACSDDGIEALGKSNTVASLLPSTSFYLNKPYAKAREMIENGAIVAISTDFNPGSAPGESIQFSMNLALLKYKMSPAEIWHAVTINPAYSLDLDRGTLKVGSVADFVIWDAKNHEFPLYHLAVNDVKKVYRNGQLVKENIK